MSLPKGSVTFLFTDIEGSTRLLHELGEDYAILLEDHRKLMRESFASWRGEEVDTQGDSFFVAFEREKEALGAAMEIQEKLHHHTWPAGAEVRVRMGLHTGQPQATDEGYVGVDVHKAARISSVAHGGQVLLSETIAARIQKDLDGGVNLRELGEYMLKDFREPEPIHQLVIPALPSNFPELKTLSAWPNNLPLQSTPFVGREDELVEIDELLAKPEIHLVTIVAPGGMGKSRLALASAEEQLYSWNASNGKEELRFPHGVYFVPLASLDSVRLLVTTIGEAIGFQFSSGNDPKEQLLEYLRGKQLLLIIDNFEHLLDGAELLAEIIEVAGGVKVLATSRARLNLRGETVFDLRGLKVPEQSVLEERGNGRMPGAIELFERSAQRVAHNFRLQAEYLPAIIDICQLVEGMPLGIELAASWIEMLSLEEIANEIKSSLGFLAADRKDAPDRHQSIRAVFDYSWKLLKVKEREIFKELSVFRGGFTREAAEFITQANLRTLRVLLDKSLIQIEQQGRYTIHELLRQYALEKLEENKDRYNELRDRHRDYFTQFIQERGSKLSAGDFKDTKPEIGNIRFAWRRAVKTRDYKSLRQADYGLFWIYLYHGWYSEGRDAFKLLVDELENEGRTGDAGIAYAMARLRMAYLSIFAMDNDLEGFDSPYQFNTRQAEVARECRDLLEELGAREGFAHGTIAMAIMSYLPDSEEYYQEINRAIRETLATLKRAKKPWILAEANIAFGITNLFQGEHERARDHLEEAREISEQIGNKRTLAWALTNLATISQQEDAYDQAKEYKLRSYHLFRDVGYRIVLGNYLLQLSAMTIIVGDYDEAEGYLHEAIPLMEDFGGQDGLAEVERGFGVLELSRGGIARAKQHLEEAIKIKERIENFEEIPLLQSDLGSVALLENNMEEARHRFHAAVQGALAAQTKWVSVYVMRALSEYFAKIGEVSRAVELAANSLSYTPTIFHFEVTMAERIREIQAELRAEYPQAKYEEWWARGLEFDIQECLQAIEPELAGYIRSRRRSENETKS